MNKIEMHNKCAKFIERLMRNNFYGEICIKFEQGEVKLITTTEKTKVQDLNID